MNNIGDYPLGAADDPRAPYNEKENPEIEIELYVGYTIGKRIKVKTNDYVLKTGVDSDGEYYKDVDTRDTDFWSLISEKCPCPKGFEEIESDFTIHGGK